MNSNLRPVRLFYRHYNYSSTPVSRKKCEVSLQHSLRIAPSNNSVKKLEWNTELSSKNLVIVGGQDARLSDLSEIGRWEILSEIAPASKIRNYSKLKTQCRQYKAKLKKAVQTEYKQGNEQTAAFIQSILDSTGFISPSEVKRAEALPMTRAKQRLKTLKTYVQLHNTFFDKPRSEKSTYVQEGIFKIPAKWEVGSDIISLQEYMHFTERFLQHHFPEHPIQLIVGHDDERLENENTGLHAHYFLGGRNLSTGEYDLRLREIELVNEYLNSQGRKNELLPQDGVLQHNQSRLLGKFFQQIVQEYTNKWLLNPKGLHAEFSDEREKRTEQYQHMISQAKLPKSQRDYSYQTRILDSLKFDIQALRKEHIKESSQLNEIKGEQVVLAHEHDTQQASKQAQLDEVEYKLQMLHEGLESKNAELEQFEYQKLQYQHELEQAAQQYLSLESYCQKKESELAYVEMVLKEKETELQSIDEKVKQQMQEILVDSYMLMQAKHKKFPKAVREFSEKISDRLDGDIPSQLTPLLDAALTESRYQPTNETSLDL
ncbi:hypothetical protein BCT09_09435 [Vibrio splendidus]|nr:hypothetical protein BCT09_09435 [Vibrio splendidus]